MEYILIVKDFYYKFLVWKLIFILQIVKNGILKTIFDLILINKKFFSKNLMLLYLSNKEKLEATIS